MQDSTIQTIAQKYSSSDVIIIITIIKTTRLSVTEASG